MPEEPAPPAEHRPIDVGVGIGFAHWTTGLNLKPGSTSSSQFAWEIAGGYTFGEPFAGASFRLGVLISGTSLDENIPAKNTLSFTSYLVEPSLRLRIVDRRVYVKGALGIGDMVIGGVKTTSVVVDPKVAAQAGAMVSTPISSFAVRPALTLQVYFTQRLLAFVEPAITSASKPAHFYQQLGRFDMLFGLAYSF